MTISPFVRDIFEESAIVSSVIIGLTPGYNLKNMKMGFHPFILRDAYRGAGLNGLNAIPQTILQVAINALMMKYLFAEKENKDLTVGEKLCCSATAGALSGIVTVPGELVVQIYYRRKDLSMRQIAHQTYQAGGLSRLCSGLTALTVRETIWSATYQTFSGIIGPIPAGVVSGALTTPCDFLRAQKQDTAMEGKPRSYWSIIKTPNPLKPCLSKSRVARVYHSAKGLFTGMISRTAVTSAACIFISLTGNYLSRNQNKSYEN